MIKKILLILLLLSGTSCTRSLGIFTTEVPRERLDLTNPAALSLRETEFKIVNRQNVENTFNDLKKNGQDPTLVALPWDSYANLTQNLNDLGNYIKLLQQTLDAYRNYYEPPKKEEPKGFWDHLWDK